MKTIKLILTGFTVFLSVTLSTAAFAQQADVEPQPAENTTAVNYTESSPVEIPTVIKSWQWPQSSTATQNFGFGRVSRSTIEGLIPPLPFSNPQVGPIVKRQPEPLEEIDTRSRAFAPKLTDGSEAFEFPLDLVATERWIRINLTEQTVTAYQGTNPQRSFLVSSGVPGYNTVTGEFRVRMKVSEQTMSGGEAGTPGYYSLPNVKWVMYFYKDYALHGSYWHDNFGNPMSHGCVNMTNADAKWLFDFAGPVWDGDQVWYKSSEENPGSRVIVHY